MPEPVALHRSVGARLFSGFWLQPILTAAVLLSVALDVVVASLVGPSLLLVQLLPTLVLVGVWAMGVTGYARADDTGVTWRYFRSHRPRWPAIDLVRYGSAFASTPGMRTRPAIFVRADGVEHPVLPAYDCPPAALAAFADGLAALAAAHGVPTEADSGYWDRLGALPGVGRAPHRLPGRVVSLSLQGLRLRLTGLALIVVTTCAWIGAFTGWESHGVGERVVFGIVGLVLLPVGLLLLLAPGA